MIVWNTNPDIGTYIELQNIIPVVLSVTDALDPSATYVYSFVDIDPPYLQITGDILSGQIFELDTWFYQKPPDFTYDTTETYGGNYCTWGSGLAGSTLVNFTIRASKTLNPLDFQDQVFTINVRNNYSSDRDNMVIEHISEFDLIVDGKKVSPQEFIDYYKSLGYYT